MDVSFDPAKRDIVLRERGLDLADAGEVFAGVYFEVVDRRQDYGETRLITIGELRGRVVVVVWTERDGGRRIISLRKANDREIERYRKQLGGSG